MISDLFQTNLQTNARMDLSHNKYSYYQIKRIQQKRNYYINKNIIKNNKKYFIKKCNNYLSIGSLNMKNISNHYTMHGKLLNNNIIMIQLKFIEKLKN